MSGRALVVAALALAACHEAPHHLGARSVPFPPSWGVASWYLDPSNSTGCASDANACQSATCGAAGSGVGPCLTWRELYSGRWGCTGAAACPHWRQTTTVTFLSPQTDATDTVYLVAALEAGATAQIIGTPTVVCSGTLSGVVARNRSAGALPQATLCAGVAQDEFIENTTRTGGAWTKALVSGSTWTLTEPVAEAPLPWTGTDPLEQDSWSNGDAYVVWAFPAVYLSTLGSSQLAGTPYSVTAFRLTASAPSGSTWWSTTTIGNTALQEVSVAGVYAADRASSQMSLNSDLRGGILFPPATTQGSPPTVKGGIIRQPFASGAGVALEASVALSGSSGATVTLTQGQVNDVFVDTGITLALTGPVYGAPYNGQASQYIWGPGTLLVQAPGSLYIGGTATSTIVGGVTTELNFFHTACAVTDAGAFACGRSLTPALIDTGVADGGFGGAAIDPAGASITTAASPF